jgi:arabinan endo-1,5-alpha-L-arabinosidase
MVGRLRKITGPYLDAEGEKMSEGAARPLLRANQQWLGPGGESILLQKDGDIIVYHAYDAKTEVPSLQISTLTCPGGGPHAALHGNASNEKRESERFLAERH